MRLRKTINGNAYVFTGNAELDNRNIKLADQGLGILSQHHIPAFSLKKQEFLYKQTATHLKRIQRIKIIGIGVTIGFILGFFIRIQMENYYHSTTNQINTTQEVLGIGSN